MNTFVIFFLILLTTFLVSTNSALHLILTAELIWINLYIMTLFEGFASDNINLLSLTFFFLIFSAVEFGVGLILILIQQILMRTLNLYTHDTNVFKFLNKYQRNININKLRF
jgi:hypothetical protein